MTQQGRVSLFGKEPRPAVKLRKNQAFTSYLLIKLETSHNSAALSRLTDLHCDHGTGTQETNCVNLPALEGTFNEQFTTRNVWFTSEIPPTRTIFPCRIHSHAALYFD